MKLQAVVLATTIPLFIYLYATRNYVTFGNAIIVLAILMLLVVSHIASHILVAIIPRRIFGHLLADLMETRIPYRWFRVWLYHQLIRLFRIPPDPSLEHLEQYESMQDFFARDINLISRGLVKIDENIIAHPGPMSMSVYSPCDGEIIFSGYLNKPTIQKLELKGL